MKRFFLILIVMLFIVSACLPETPLPPDPPTGTDTPPTYPGPVDVT